MSTQILIKRSSVASAVPTTSDIATGELAVNTVDKRIFTNNNGTIVELGTYPSTQAVAGNATVGGTLGVTGATTLSSGSVTGNFSVAGTLTVASPVNSTDAASKGYVDAQVSAVIDAAPAALDTLNELAAALNDDANFATTVTNALNTKLNKAGDTMTGTLVMGANKVTSTATPTAADDLTRKGYVDGLYQSTVDAEVSAANALASEQAAATSATNSATSASASATSASAASTSATNAASSATAAASSATSSANSATASATSATQSAASATQAQALVDSIESFYLGAEASAPTVDDNGDPLQAGDWYFNTTDNTTYIYNGSSWQSVSPDLVSDLTPQLGGNLSTNGNDITFGDNDRAIFGAGSDLQIYHDGSHSRIYDNGTGDLKLVTNGAKIVLQSPTETMLTAVPDAEVTLYHNDLPKLSTTSTGIDVTGTATMDGLTVEGVSNFNDTVGVNSTSGYANVEIGGTSGAYIDLKAPNSDDYDLRVIHHEYSGNPYNVLDAKSGDLYIATGASALNRIRVENTTGDISFYEDTGTTAKFFWDASAESLGIGTSSPNAPLSVRASSPAATVANMFDSAGFGFYFKTSNIAPYPQMLHVGGSESLAFGTNGANERMRIDSSGNVGIGTASPSAKLDSHSNTAGLRATRAANTDQYIELVGGDGAGLSHINANYQMAFKTGDIERMRIDSSGNVGIGTSSPSGKLSVALGTSYSAGSGWTDSTAVFGAGTSTGGGLGIAYDDTNGGVIASIIPAVAWKPIEFQSSELVFSTNGASERMRLDASGNLLVGKSSADGGASNGLQVGSNGNTYITRTSATANTNTVLALDRKSSDGEILRLRKDGTTVGSIGCNGGRVYIGQGATGLDFEDTTDAIRPNNPSTGAGRDNVIDLGRPDVRFDDIYATNGTIQTSDANEKQDIDVLNDAEQRVAQACKGLLRKFRWKDAVAEKGDDARIHFGIIAQDLKAAFEAEGLDAGKYAMFISSTWTDEETGEERTRMGVRYPELLAFIIATL